MRPQSLQELQVLLSDNHCQLIDAHVRFSVEYPEERLRNRLEIWQRFQLGIPQWLAPYYDRDHPDNGEFCARYNHRVAVKYWMIATKKQKDEFTQELETLRELARDLSIVPTVYYSGCPQMPNDRQHTYAVIVMELCDMDLRHCVLRSNQDTAEALSVAERRSIISQLVKAYHYCHERNIAHRDVKPENVLVVRNSDGHWQVKLCDFALSKQVNTVSQAINTVINPLPHELQQMWTPPEMVVGSAYNMHCDIWGLGCLAYFVATGQVLFRTAAERDNEDGHAQLLHDHDVSDPNRGYLNDFPMLPDLILALVHNNPEDRMPLTAAINHPALWRPQLLCDFVQCLAKEVQLQRQVLVMELCNMDLRSCILRSNQDAAEALSVAERRSIISQLVKAYHYCHAKNIVHRDVKPENVLVVRNSDHWQVKLCDFALSKRVSAMSQALNTVINPLPNEQQQMWTPPEMVEGSYNMRCDIWGLGCLAYFVATGQVLFRTAAERDNDGGHAQLLRDHDVLDNNGFRTMHYFPLLPDLILSLVKSNPRDRMPLELAIGHPALWQPLRLCDFLRSLAEEGLREGQTTGEISHWREHGLPPTPPGTPDSNAYLVPPDLEAVARTRPLLASWRAWLGNQEHCDDVAARVKQRGTMVFAGQRSGSGKTLYGQLLHRPPQRALESLMSSIAESPVISRERDALVIERILSARYLVVDLREMNPHLGSLDCALREIVWRREKGSLQLIMEEIRALTGRSFVVHFDEVNSLKDDKYAGYFGPIEGLLQEHRTLSRYYAFWSQVHSLVLTKDMFVYCSGLDASIALVGGGALSYVGLRPPGIAVQVVLGALGPEDVVETMKLTHLREREGICTTRETIASFIGFSDDDSLLRFATRLVKYSGGLARAVRYILDYICRRLAAERKVLPPEQHYAPDDAYIDALFNQENELATRSGMPATRVMSFVRDRGAFDPVVPLLLWMSLLGVDIEVQFEGKGQETFRIVFGDMDIRALLTEGSGLYSPVLRRAYDLRRSGVVNKGELLQSVEQELFFKLLYVCTAAGSRSTHFGEMWPGLKGMGLPEEIWNAELTLNIKLPHYTLPQINGNVKEDWKCLFDAGYVVESSCGSFLPHSESVDGLYAKPPLLVGVQHKEFGADCADEETYASDITAEIRKMELMWKSGGAAIETAMDERYPLRVLMLIAPNPPRWGDLPHILGPGAHGIGPRSRVPLESSFGKDQVKLLQEIADARPVPQNSAVPLLIA
eukprot:m51a1_g11595 putative calcium-dependent protein kinase (1243) ;mRNA; f:102585-113069